MEWLATLIPLIREGAALIQTFQRDNGRAPTDEELMASFQARAAAETNWADSLARKRAEENPG
jgi:hypothetical protein